MPDTVRIAGLHAGEVGSLMELVDQNLHVHGELGIWVDGLRCMAHDAELHLDARAAVAEQGIVTLIASLGGDNRAGHLHRGTVRNETKDVVRGLAPLIEGSEFGEVAGCRDSDGMSGGG